MKKIRVLNDVAFHYVFGRDTTKENLIHFLNAVLAKTQPEPISDLTLKETKLDPELVGKKSCRLDIRATAANGTHINVEVQIRDQADIEKRSVFYWSKLYLSQLHKGEPYKELAPAIAINLLDFTYFEHPGVHSTYCILEEDTHSLLTDVLEIHFLELPKLKKQSQLDLTCPLIRWLMFLSEDTDQKIMEEIVMRDETIHRANQDLERLVMDEDALRLYELREKALRDERSNLDAAWEKGRKEGQRQSQTRIIQELLARGFSNEFISEVTKISREQLEVLKQEVE